MFEEAHLSEIHHGDTETPSYTRRRACSVRSDRGPQRGSRGGVETSVTL